VTTNLLNWAGNHTFCAARYHAPTTVAHVQAIVQQSNKVRVLGSRHCFHDIADCTEDLILLDKLAPTLLFDNQGKTVTVNGGCNYIQLGAWLHQAGYAVHNMASLPHITIAGAIATATHGSGDTNGNLATAVAGMELVTADGEVITLSRTRDGDTLQGAVVGLGALGVVTKVTLDIEPAYLMQQEVYENMAFAQVVENFDAITASAYSVSLFTDWKDDKVSQVWVKHKLTNGEARPVAPIFYGAPLAPCNRHPVTTFDADLCTIQMGIPGPWHERLAHFHNACALTSKGDSQSEYFVAREHAVPAMKAMAELEPVLAPVLLLSEVRTIAADDLWLSPNYQRPSIGLHFSWNKPWDEVKQVLPLIEERLAPFQARPHWGKLFTMTAAQLQPLYPRWTDFQTLLRRFDPTGKFCNAYLERYFFA
jgi:alditol oxidase